jgi:serine/threonine protein kinase
MIENKIGKYKIIRLIGEGGMASVYEAEHEMLGTKVAIKVLNPILSANAQIKERFRNEAKLMASLDHPNITKVIDFDEQPQQLSIVMEFLNGEDLNDKIKRNGPLTEKEITDVFSQTLSAFQYAHEKGIVHRDIKPSNIFILKNGHVKILDFGIAKLFGQGNEMTQTGTQMGTPIYMSPEQVKADKSIDHRSDIYSLGVTMFYALNGKPPYNSDTDSQFDIFNKIVYEPLPEFSAQNNHHLIVSKACEKNREERFQTCFEFLQAFSLTSLNPESNEKTIIDEKITNNKKEEKTILNVESDSNNQNVENSNFPNKAKNPNNKKKTISIITALALLILGVWVVFNFNNKTTDVKNNNVISTNNPIADTTFENVVDTTQVSAMKAPQTPNTEETDKLIGRHKLSLQWISWTYFGYVDFVKTDLNTYSISGYQDGNKSKGECDGCYLKINGVIKKITDKELQFNGRIESSVNHIQNGLPCIKEGTYTFKSTQGRRYWRLQEMDGCEGVTDYVDIYF